jgi:hypothetical protein
VGAEAWTSGRARGWVVMVPEGSQTVEPSPLVDAEICATLARPCA